MSEKTFIHILDSSLRDGSHALSHQYTAAQVSSVARGLDDAGVEMIEVSHAPVAQRPNSLDLEMAEKVHHASRH